MQKKSIKIFGHSTSVSLEPEFWQALEAIAQKNNVRIANLIEKIDTQDSLRKNLASKLRVFSLKMMTCNHMHSL